MSSILHLAPPSFSSDKIVLVENCHPPFPQFLEQSPHALQSLLKTQAAEMACKSRNFLYRKKIVIAPTSSKERKTSKEGNKPT
jgi:hypothetical protein